MTSMFPQIFQNFKLLECSSTQRLFRYIYIIIQLTPNLTIISDDICKELMKVVLKMYDAVLVLNENVKKGIQGQRKETIQGPYSIDEYSIPCLPPSRKEEEYCYYELLWTNNIGRIINRKIFNFWNAPNIKCSYYFYILYYFRLHIEFFITVRRRRNDLLFN